MALLQVYFWNFWAYATSEILMWFWSRVLGSFLLGLPIFVFAYIQFWKSQRDPGKPRGPGDEEWFLDHMAYEGAMYWVILHGLFSGWRTYSLYLSSGTFEFTQLNYIPYGTLMVFEFFIFLHLKGKSRLNPQFLPEETYL